MDTELRFKSRAAEFFFWVLLTLAFVISFGGYFAQYHSNQNDHLLRGLAAGPVDSLASDWYVNTKNPEPVFSIIVQVSSQLFSPSIFFLLQTAVLGIFLFSLIGISDHFFHLKRSQFLFFAFFAVFLFTNTKAFINLLGTGLYYGVAGQGLALHEFLPNVFAAFLFLSLYLFLKEKYIWAVLSLCLAGYIHIGYEMAAALLTFTYMFIIFLKTKNLKTPLLLGLLALIVISPMVIYTYQSNANATSQQIHEAAQIIVQERIPHHTQVKIWWGPAETTQTIICLLALVIMRKTRLFWFLLFGVLLIYLPAVVQLFRPSNLIGILQIWRVSVLVVPVSSILVLGAIISTLFERFGSFIRRHGRLIRILFAALIAFSLIQGFSIQLFRIQADAQKLTNELYAFVKEQRTDGTTYLIPPRDQRLEDFRLGTETPIVVDWKSHPWNSVEALEWYQRINDADAFYAKEGSSACQVLPEIVSTYRVTNILSYADQPLDCSALAPIYQDAEFIVYRVVSDN
jgi:hypothetical protein